MLRRPKCSKNEVVAPKEAEEDNVASGILFIIYVNIQVLLTFWHRSFTFKF